MQLCLATLMLIPKYAMLQLGESLGNRVDGHS